MNIVDNSWMPVCAMKRIICHWTAGGYKATSLDKEHYHILIEGDGTLVRGRYSIADNVSTADGKYAAHTRGCNTGSIGVAMCCMAGARRAPFRAGQYPMTELQWDVMLRVGAELCAFYDISVTPQTVLGHGEVQAHLSMPQAGKWDPMRLPFAPKLYAHEVGSLLRRQVKAQLGKVVRMSHEEHYPSCWVDIPSMSFFGSGIVANGTTYVSAAELGEIEKLSPVLRTIPSFTFGTLHVSCRQLANALNLPISWDGSTRTVTIGDKK